MFNSRIIYTQLHLFDIPMKYNILLHTYGILIWFFFLVSLWLSPGCTTMRDEWKFSVFLLLYFFTCNVESFVVNERCCGSFEYTHWQKKKHTKILFSDKQFDDPCVLDDGVCFHVYNQHIYSIPNEFLSLKTHTHICYLCICLAVHRNSCRQKSHLFQFACFVKFDRWNT